MRGKNKTIKFDVGVDIDSDGGKPMLPGGKRRRWAPAYKLAILAEYETLDRVGKGELLRRENLDSSLLAEWRKHRDQGAVEALASGPGRPRVDPVERENTRLRQQVERLESDLLRARSVIEAQGKCLALLGELATDSATTNGDATN
jgi:transposase-like protein